MINGKAQPTIPFFSISCTVGSSCSQIISARQTHTKPTFKPYTQDEISKFKGTLGSSFPSSVLTVNLGLQQTAKQTGSVQTTTVKPISWRIKTTTTAPSSSAVEHETKWKWPTDKEIDRNAENWNHNREKVDTQPTTLLPPKLSTWTPQLSADAADDSKLSDQKTSFRIKPNPVSEYQFPSTTTTHRPPTSGWISLLAATLKNGLQQQHNKHSPESFKQPNAHKPTSPPISPWIPSDEISNSVARDPASSMGWTAENHREVVSMKGNKISLITGPSNRQKINNKPPQSSSITLPPEVSVSSHLIGLRVKPKSLNHRGNFENIQGVAVETDGENVNLSDLIMRQPLPPRPARYLTWTQDRQRQLSARNLPQFDSTRRYYQQQDDPRHHHFSSADSEWRPIYFPRNWK